VSCHVGSLQMFKLNIPSYEDAVVMFNLNIEINHARRGTDATVLHMLHQRV
jgi:hypothetical protein